jgi:hypothetical protein
LRFRRACGRLRIVRVADRADDDDPFGARGDDLLDVGRVDPPNREPRNGRVRCGELDQPEACRGPALLRRCFPDRPDADLVGAGVPVGLAGGGHLLLGVGREANQRRRPRDRPRLGDGHVVLAEVDAVGFAADDEVGSVVEDEEGAVLVGRLPEWPCRLDEPGV